MKSEQQITGKFYTPQPLANAIVSLISDEIGGTTPKRILEPSVGGGAFAKACRERWPTAKITGVDIDQNAPGFEHCDECIREDFLCTKLSSPDYDIVLGNPPFSIHEERIVRGKPELVKVEVGEAHVRKAIAHTRTGGACAMLLRAAFLHPAKRSDLLDHLDIESKVSPRPTFTIGSSSDNTDYCVLIWRNDTFPANTIRRLTWDKPPKRQRKEP